VYWLLAGGIGFGIFYSGIYFAADHAPGWIIAATWQLTILASALLVLPLLFRTPVPTRGKVFAIITFSGIVALNMRQLSGGLSIEEILSGVLPVAIAALAYPVGNQMLNERMHAGDVQGALSDPFSGVFLLTLGSLPVFIALAIIMRPPPPTSEQLLQTLIIAGMAGCLATSLFFYARNLSNDAFRIAAVDATQAGEVAFALLGEVLLLGAPWPDWTGWFGLFAVSVGLVGFALRR
jgi:drug/metabolite transporter (DMT)-like permease